MPWNLRQALRWGVFGGLVSCHPEASVAQRECRTDADCADGGRCREARCAAPAAAPVRISSSSTALPEASAAAVAEGPRRRGPTDAPREQWAVESGAVIYAQPVLVETGAQVVAYVGNHAGRFMGVVVEGPQAGRIVLDLWVDGIIWSTAAVDARGWLYFGADDDHLYAVDPVAKSIAWRRRLGTCEPARAPGPEGVRCDVDGGPTLGPQGDLFVGADGLYRVGTDGEVRWHYPPEAAGRGAHVATTPLVTDELVVFGTYGRRLVALDHAGTLRWELPAGADVDGSPVVGRDGTIYAGADDGWLRAVTPEGVVRWSFDAGAEIQSRPAVGADGTLVFGTQGGRLHAVEPDGTARWVLPVGRALHAPPTLDAAGRIFVGGRDERLYALDLHGHVYWDLEFPEQIDSGVAVSPNGTLVVGCDDGVLRGLR